MNGALVIDTETTGIDEPEVIQLAYVGPRESPQSTGAVSFSVCWFKPSKPISYGAMAVHHILAEDLASYPLWPGHWKLPEGVDFLIGHKVDFDWKAIGSPIVKRICTLALARSIWPDVDSHSLSALTYFLMERHRARELLRDAHDARRDVELCCYLLAVILASLPHVRSWHDLWVESEKARMPERMDFGKYGPDSDYAKANGGKGMRCAEVRRLDPGYWSWLMAKCDRVREDPYLQKALQGEAA